MCGIEIDLVLVRGSKLTSFLCAGLKLLGFSVLIEIDLVLSLGIDVNLVFVWGLKIIRFERGDRWSCFFVWAVF